MSLVKAQTICCIKCKCLFSFKCFSSVFSQHESYRRLSYQTISGVGPHAAMPHYMPTNETDRQITRSEIYLIDSGTQYKGKYHSDYVQNGFSMFTINHRIYFRSLPSHLIYT